jgi:hypothetical protein
VAGEGLITENFFILRTLSLKALTGTRKPPLGAGFFCRIIRPAKISSRYPSSLSGNPLKFQLGKRVGSPFSKTI